MMDIAIGSVVIILPPFNVAYPGEYTVERNEITADGSRAYFVGGIEGGFDARFLEVIHAA